MQLQIRHTGESREGNPEFVVVFDGKQDTRTVLLTPPKMIKIGTHNTNLLQDLHWYFEKYLEIPIGDYPVRAEEIQSGLKQWGQDCFEALFGTGRASGWYRDARQKRLSDLCFKIASDDPAVLSWPWEALESRDDGFLAQQCRIERQLDDIGDAFPLSDDLPADRLNILYIIARTGGDADVGFQTLARPLVDFVDEDKWPVHIDVLRPPTLKQLRKILDERRNFYHIVHFDGHGVFENTTVPTGVLLFESEGQEEERVPAAKLGELLRPHNIPVMILTACQSAMTDESADDPFASVAMNLLKAGIRSVVAMSYSLWVSGARVFVPEFYRRLFSDGNVAVAMQAARLQMYEENMRDTFTGKIEFNDWVVPVLYQQSADGILPQLKQGDERIRKLPPEALDLGDYGFIGRDRTIRRLEKAIRMNTAGILIHGMAGEGKTTIAKGFLQWLDATHGLHADVFWFSFEDIHNAGFIIDTLTDKLFGTQEMSLAADRKLSIVTKALRDNPYFMVWDNFESASGIPGTEVSALLQDDDRKLLKQLLRNLRGGQTKVMITSRSPESWLNIQECFRLPLDGLKGEELWQYCNAVVADLGLSLDRKAGTYKELMDKLDGNPLAVRAILFRLAENPAEELLGELEDNFRGYEGDDATNRIQAALSVFERGLDRDFAPALRLLGLHEHYADIEKIGAMLEKTGETAPLEDCFAALESAGLCRPIGNDAYQIHPALRGCLTRQHPAEEAGERAFVGVMGNLADEYSQKQLHEQRSVLRLFGANFHRALKLALELDMREHALALLQVLAAFSQSTRNFSEAERLIKLLAKAAKEFCNEDIEAVAYHHLGVNAQERRDFSTAETLYKQSLDIELKRGNEIAAAKTYHNLGIIAQERRDFDGAEDWYKQSIDVWNKCGDENALANTRYQLGILAQERRDFDSAEIFYKQALETWQKQGNEPDVVKAYQQLGMLSCERRDFNAAETLYLQSLDVSRKLEDEYSISVAYQQLGLIAQERRNYNAAEDWYKQSLKIELKLGDEYEAGIAYHQLGIIAQLQNDFSAAEKWFNHSLEISLKLEDEKSAAKAYYHQGVIASLQKDFSGAENKFRQSLDISLKLGDEYSAAKVYFQQGAIAFEHKNLSHAADLYSQAMTIYRKYNDLHNSETTMQILLQIKQILSQIQ